MFRFSGYVLKTLWRHRLRTFLTLSGAAVALFVYYMVATVQRSLDALKGQSDRVLVVFQANKFCPATSQLQQDYERTIAKMAGVQDVLPIQVFTNNCRASLDVIVFYGVPADKLQRFRNFHMVHGDWESFIRNQDAAIVGQGVAQRRKLSPGKKFSIGDITVTVAGVYNCADKAEENYIYTHLKFLQRQLGKGPEAESANQQQEHTTVTQFEVQVADDADPKKVCLDIDDAFRTSAAATDTRPKGVFQASAMADLFQLITLAHYLGYACVGLMMVLVATTSLMSVQDRIREHAVLQTLGFSPWQIFGLVTAESLLVSLAGGVVGIGLAVLRLWWMPLSVAAEAVAITLEPTLALAGIGLLLSLVIGVVAGFFPAWQAAWTEIVPALRQG
jgi:putative ABC transport system permease protein